MLRSRTTPPLIEKNPLKRFLHSGNESSSEKAPYPLFYKLAIGATSLVILFVPFLALANPFSLAALLSGFGKKVDAASAESTNSQRMALLSPATNIDPNPIKSGSNLPVEEGSALAASMGPSGTAADVEDIPTSSQISVYTVRAGDTLSAIASMFGVSINTIIWANDLKGGTIHEGDQLVILPVTGISHTVLAGETLMSLAQKYGGTADEIAQYNGVDATAALVVGDTIIIPNGEIQTSVGTPKGKTTGKTSGSKTTKPWVGSKKHKGVSSSEPYLGGSGPAIGNFVWPVAGGQITQGLHGWNAVDIGAPTGTSIFAAAGGTVIVARSGGGWNGGYGNYVVISHPDGTQTLYAHMSKVLASGGEEVSQGQTIGLVGATGEATGPHLHFEVRGAQNPFAN